MMAKTKTLAARSIIIGVYVLLLCVMFYTGRTHTVLIDNKDVDGISAIRSVTITIGDESTGFRRGDRDKYTIKGQKLRITVAPMGGEEQSFSISIPLKEDTMLLSIPKLLANSMPYITPYDLYAKNERTAPNNETEEPVASSKF